MSSVPNRDRASIPTARQHLLASFDREHGTTMRVLKALPKEKSELRPHPQCKTARELAWMFVLEQGAMEKGLTTGFDWSKPPAFPPPPEAYGEVLATFEKGHARIIELLMELNRESGTTVVLVTHDEALASRATRIIRLADGAVVHDSGAASAA